MARLRAAGCVFAEDEAALLVEAADSERELTELADRRVAGEPLEQVLGWAEFCGLRIWVEPGVFVPRRRTEILVREAVRLAGADVGVGADGGAGAGAVVVDLCCGSGAVGASMAAAHDGLELYAADIDPPAVHCARRNLEPRGGQVFQGDLYAALPGSLRGRVDLLLVNAPYVPSDEIGFMPTEARMHEPRVALDGGSDGLDLHRRVASGAPAWLAPGGHLLIETSALQLEGSLAALADAGLLAHAVKAPELDAVAVVGTLAGTP